MALGDAPSLSLDALTYFSSQLADTDGLELLELTSEEKQILAQQFRACLQHLHGAGYAHGDIAPRNLCARRTLLRTPPPATPETADASGFQASTLDTSRPSSPPSSKADVVEGRIIDLTEARLLESLSQEQQEAMKSEDLMQLTDVLAEFVGGQT